MEDNSIDDIHIINVEGIPSQLTETVEGTWLIANDKSILECMYGKDGLKIMRRYELDPADNQVTELQSSNLFVVARTSQGHLYTFDRKYTELKYLLNKE